MAELKFLSLGWGVQSFTIAAMTALEELAPVDLAIHADTTHEAEGTYRHAEKYTPWLESRGLKVVTVSAKDTGLFWSTHGVMIPAFTQTRTSRIRTTNLGLGTPLASLAPCLPHRLSRPGSTSTGVSPTTRLTAGSSRWP